MRFPGLRSAPGDFDSDGVEDIAIGSMGPVAGGQVHVLYDLGATPVRQTLQDASPVSGDDFGTTMVAGSFFPGAGLDLVVGVPDKDILGVDGAGVVRYFPSALLHRDGFETAETSSWTSASP